MHKDFIQTIKNSISVKENLINDVDLLHQLEVAVNKIVDCYHNNGKVLFCGNGGSAADAQHLAAELSGRFYYDRPPLQAEALHVNSSFVTAVANDYGYDYVFARMVEAWGRENDILVALSTSGSSQNILRAVESARKQQMMIIGFTGAGGGKLKSMCDIILEIPSTDTPRVQESHILIGHILCEHVEKILFPKP
jgi:D-sedoheptulose 7-phosphate isomerase